MKLKRLLPVALMLALVLMLTLLPIRAEAATVASGTCGDNLTWVLDDKGTLTISGTGPMDDLWSDHPWESFRASVKKATITDGVTTIGERAFYGCSNLTSVTIPDSVTTIGYGAFCGCSSMTSVTIPNSITIINGSAFEGCDSLTSVAIPDSVTTLGSSAFLGCDTLNSVTIGSGITSIGYGTFYYCESLASVTIPNSVTSIDDKAFYYCTSLTSITIGSGVKYIGEEAFIGCDSLTSVTIPDSVTTLDDYAFCGCDNLTSVTIGNGVEYIGDGAFRACPKLTGIYVASNNPNYSSNSSGVLFNKNKTTLIQAPGALSGRYTIPNSVTTIGYSAFSGCESLTSVTIPNSVTDLGEAAFARCGLTDMTIPNSVTTISDSAFSGCESLTSVIIPDSVTYIDDYAFCGCASLTSVTIPNSVTTIGMYAFDSCISLKSVTIPNSVTELGKAAFAHCGLTDVTIGNAVEYIGYYAFFFCESLTSVTIPDSVIYIYDYAFHCCYSLTSVTIGNSVEYIGDHAFFDCRGLINVTIPDSVEYIGEDAFAYCTSLTSVTIGSGVKDIDDYAFDVCYDLETVCYNGTSAQWNTISIGTKNTYLTQADIHYNENQDHKCDSCGTIYCIDVNKDDKCDICGASLLDPAPEKPYKIANVVSGVHVYWKETAGVAKYGLWRSETGKNGTYKWIANPTVPHFTDTKVTSGKTYYYKVTTMNAAGKHSEKSEAIGVTYVATPDITSRINKAAGITVGWNKIAGATGYAIYRKTYSGNDAWVRVGTIEGNATLSWTDTSVKNNNGTAYKYTVRALAGSDMKTLSGCRNAGRSMGRLTSRTLNSAVKTSATSIKCSWNTSSAVTGYEVRFMVDSTVYKTFPIGNYKTGVKTFTGLKAGQTYKIQVRSYVKIDGMGFYSAWSEAKNVKLP